jgi:hypothetical protein
MRKVVSVFCLLAAFLVIPLAGQAVASSAALEINPEDLTFEGDFLFDLNGMYYVNGWYPLNVLGYLEVFDGGEKLGDMSLNGQKNDGGTYFGHWTFDPAGCGFCDHEGLLPDLSQFQEQGVEMLAFTLLGLGEVLGMPGELPRIEGTLEGNEFVGCPIPIPGGLFLLGSGLVVLVGLGARRKSGQ